MVLNAFYESSDLSEIRPEHFPSKIRAQKKIKNNGQSSHVLTLYEAIVWEQKDFWREVYKPYRKGDFNRYQLQELCEFGFTKIGSRNIQELGKHFNINNSNQKKFYDFVHRTIFNS